MFGCFFVQTSGFCRSIKMSSFVSSYQTKDKDWKSGTREPTESYLCKTEDSRKKSSDLQAV